VSATPFRIGVDGHAFASPAGGVRRYVSELYGALAGIAPDVDVVAIGAPAGTPLPPRVTRRAVRSLPTNLGWMAASLPLAARGAGLDVFHAPAYTAPLWGVHPQVLTIHDVSYERKPEWNPYRNDRLRRAFYRRAALAADRIITDSAFSRQEIVAAYGIADSRIDVVPLAASPVFSPGTFDASRAPAGIAGPYALHVGDLHVRRNLGTVLDAILQVRAAGSRLTLVCAGVDRGIGESLRTAAAADPDVLVLTGAVADDVLVNLYRGATLLVYPSMYEGFGLPLLEAMQCGVPVAAARCASVPEVTGAAAVLLAPLDVRAWRDAIAALCQDQPMRSRLREAGLARAGQFSWTRTAADTLAILRRCAR
jgi:glycosyltransferase involved in cell wall biosynthesis